MTKRIVKNQHEPPISPPLQQQYQSYYGITLIETLMSVGLLGLVLIPMLMTSSAYLSTKIMGTRSTTDLATNVNALDSKLNTLAATAATVNPAVSDATTLSLSVQLANGVRRSFEYSLTGAPGSQRLREVQGNATTRSAHSALRSSDTIALTGNAAFGYCARFTCTSTTNTAAQNYGIMKAADVVFLDGNVTTPVTRTAAGFTGLDTVQFAQLAGTDGSGKSMNLPVNVFALGTDPYVAENGGQPNPDSGSPSTTIDPVTGLPVTTLGTGDGTPNAAHDSVVNNPRPFGVITAKSKTAVFGMDDADINVFSGSGTFSAVPMATQLPPAPFRGISQVPYSRIYKEGAGDGTTGNVKPILSNFRLDQTVADSFQGNMCFTGNRGLDGAFQVYYWNRTLPTALLTSVQNATNPFNMTPECAGASAGYSAYNPNQGNYYVQTYQRLQYQTPTTWVDVNTPLGFVENWNGWVEPIRQIWQTNREAHYQWYAWDKPNGYRSPMSGRTYFYTDGKVGWMRCGWFGACIAGIWRFWEPTGYGNINKPVFATPMPAVDQIWNEFQVQPTPQVGFHTLVHQRGNDPVIPVTVDVLDPFLGNQQRQLYQRGRRTFNIYGTEGQNRQGDKQSCDFTPVPRPYSNRNGRPAKYLVCSDMHRPENIQYFQPPNCKVRYESRPQNPPTWTRVPLANLAGTRVFGSVTGNTFTLEYYETNIDGETDYFFDNRDFVLDGLACKKCWAGIPSSLSNSTTLIGSQRPVQTTWEYQYDEYGDLVYDQNGQPVRIEVKYVSFYNNLNNIGGRSDTYQNFRLIKNDGPDAQPNSYVFDLGGQDGWRYQSNGFQAYISECNIWQQAQWAQVPGIKRYINANPSVVGGVQSDTINSFFGSGATQPYIIRRDNTDDLFYHLVNSNGSRVYAFSPAINRTIAGPPVNTDWSAVAQTRMAQGKRVLSYSPVNRLAITGNTSGYGDVYAWYYDNADQPVPTIKQGGLGFNAGQVNGPRVNYIGKPNMQAAYQDNLTAIASEGNNVYTLDRTTGMITRYGAEAGSRNYVRQSEATYASAILSPRGTLAVSPLDDGMYILNADTKRVTYFSNRRGGATLVQQGNGTYSVVGQANNMLQPVGQRSFNATQAVLPTGLAISKVTGNVYVLDSNIGTVTQGSETTRTLNIQVYNANGEFLRTFALDVTDKMFRNANDRLVPQNGQIMRLSLDEARSQFYVSVGSNGKIYQFGVDQTI